MIKMKKIIFMMTLISKKKAQKNFNVDKGVFCESEIDQEEGQVYFLALHKRIKH